jgi:hypothetical protein
VGEELHCTKFASTSIIRAMTASYKNKKKQKMMMEITEALNKTAKH